MNLTVIKSTESSNGGYVTTLQFVTKDRMVVHNGVKIKKKGRTLTYYLNTIDQYQPDELIELDMDEFDVVERPFKAHEGTPDEIDITLKWLHLKD